MFEEFTVYSLSSVISDDATSSATLLADARPILLPAGLLDAIKTITEPDTLFRLQALLRIIFVKNETDHANETDYASDNASLLAGLVDVLYNSYLMTTDKISLFEKEKRQKAAGKLTGPQDEAEALRWLLQNFNLEKSSADPYALYFVLTTSGIDLSLLSSQDGAHFLRAQAVTRRLLEEKRTALKLSPTNEQLDGLPVFSLTGTLSIPEENRLVRGKSPLLDDVAEAAKRAIAERFGTRDGLYVFDFAENEDGSLSLALSPSAHAMVLSLRARGAGQVILECLPGSSTDTEVKFVVRAVTNASGFLRAQADDTIQASSLAATLHKKKAFFLHYEDHSLDTAAGPSTAAGAAASRVSSRTSLSSGTLIALDLVEKLRSSAAVSQRTSANASPAEGAPIGQLAPALVRFSSIAGGSQELSTRERDQDADAMEKPAL